MIDIEKRKRGIGKKGGGDGDSKGWRYMTVQRNERYVFLRQNRPSRDKAATELA